MNSRNALLALVGGCALCCLMPLAPFLVAGGTVSLGWIVKPDLAICLLLPLAAMAAIWMLARMNRRKAAENCECAQSCPTAECGPGAST